MDFMTNYNLSRKWPGIPPLRAFHVWSDHSYTMPIDKVTKEELLKRGWTLYKIRKLQRIAAAEGNEIIKRLVQTK